MLKSQKGFAHLYFIFGFLILLIAIALYFYKNPLFINRALLNINSTNNETGNQVYSLSGYVYIDENNNNTYDEGEKPLEDVGIQLLLPSDETRLVRTDNEGMYTFSSLKPLNTYENPINKYYIVSIINPSSEGKEYEALGIVSENFQVPPDTRQDFPVLPRANLQGITINVFIDNNGNGLREPDENGFPGAEISIFNSGSGSTILTDDEGVYSFTDIYGGYVSVILKIPDGYISTSYEERDGGFINIFIDINSENRNLNLGIKPGTAKNREFDPNKTYEVSGWIFIDSNKNGIKDSGEKGLSCSDSCINSLEGKGFLLSLVKWQVNEQQHGGIGTDSEGFYSTSQWLRQGLSQPRGGIYHIAVPTYSIPGYRPTTSFDKTFTLNSNKIINFGVVRE